MPDPATPVSGTPVIAVWPCEHGNVLVEPGPARPGYRCHECGATARTYVAADEVPMGGQIVTELLKEGRTP